MMKSSQPRATAARKLALPEEVPAERQRLAIEKAAEGGQFSGLTIDRWKGSSFRSIWSATCSGSSTLAIAGADSRSAGLAVRASMAAYVPRLSGGPNSSKTPLSLAAGRSYSLSVVLPSAKQR
jgi:hypothetical protein